MFREAQSKALPLVQPFPYGNKIQFISIQFNGAGTWAMLALLCSQEIGVTLAVTSVGYGATI